MKRNLSGLTTRPFDLLIIGGGITGANIAWDASLRGLRVALVDKQDFGAATSANSLKTVHGGLRYLQDFNLRIVRKMIKERRSLLQIAPHLVRPLPVVMPTVKNKLMRSLPVLGTAVKLNDWISFDRNVGVDPARHLAKGRVLSRHKVLDRLPGLAHEPHLSGGVLWYDAQIVNTERLLLSFIQSAVDAGAAAANYVAVKRYIVDEGTVTGVEAKDELTGKPFKIAARLVVNAAGPWVDTLLGSLNIQYSRPAFPLSTAMNLVTRQLIKETAVGLTGRYDHQLADGKIEKRSRVLFIAPWREYSLVGTVHAPFKGSPDDQWVTEKNINDFIVEVNDAYPTANLQRQDVYLVHRGFLPTLPDNPDPSTVSLIREGQVIDHALENGVDGLITAIGVKYTTGRYLAEKTVDVIFGKLKQPSPPCRTHNTRLISGHIDHLDIFMQTAMDKWPVELPPYQIERLLTNYGSLYGSLLPIIKEDMGLAQPVDVNTAVTKAEIIHAIRAEMAVNLGDVVLRRTEMGSAGPPAPQTLQATAELMGRELGWNKRQQQQQIDDVLISYNTQQNV